MIDSMVEEPLRKACKTLKNKGIETVMSSANKKNVLENGEKRIEKKDVEGKEFLLDSPTYEDAGKGYAWIMINYDTLSDKNKEIVFSLQQVKDNKGNNIGDKIVWLVKSLNILFDFHLGENKKEKDNLTEKFDNQSFILRYNNRYPNRVVFLRMPINENSTIREVEEYFDSLTKNLKQQKMLKNDTLNNKRDR